MAQRPNAGSSPCRDAGTVQNHTIFALARPTGWIERRRGTSYASIESGDHSLPSVATVFLLSQVRPSRTAWLLDASAPNSPEAGALASVRWGWHGLEGRTPCAPGDRGLLSAAAVQGLALTQDV